MEITHRNGQPLVLPYVVSFHAHRDEWLLRYNGREIAASKNENELRAQAQILNKC